MHDLRRDNDHIGRSLERVRRLAWWLDDSIRVPGTSIRLGMDPLIGLIPGLGDALGLLLSSYVLFEAGRLGVSRSTLLRMGVNVLIESVVGMIPLLGDLFDAGWKSNRRNLRLLERSLAAPTRAHRRDRGFIALLLIGIGGTGIALVAGAFLLLQWLLTL